MNLQGQVSTQATSNAIRMAITLMLVVIGFAVLATAAFVAVSQGNLAQHATGTIVIGAAVYTMVVSLLVIPAVIKIAKLDLCHDCYTITPESLSISERRYLRGWPWLDSGITDVPLQEIEAVHPKRDLWDRTFRCGSIHVATCNGEVLKVGPIHNATEFEESLLHEMLITAEYSSVDDY